MRNRNPGISKAADACGDARNDPKRNSSGGQRQRLLAAAAENAGIAALEPQHAMVGFGEPDPRIDQRVVDDKVGAREGVQRQHRKQPRVARTRSNKPDAAGVELRQSKKRAVDQSDLPDPRAGYREDTR